MDILPSLQTGKQVVMLAPAAAPAPTTHLIAQLGLRGAVTVLDGGNGFQAYRVLGLLRRQTVAVAAIATRITIRRAFNCYQMLALLESTPSRPQPHIVLDLLATFYDDHVTHREAQRLLRASLHQLARLGQVAPVVITLAPAKVAARAYLVQQVCQQADQCFTFQPPTQSATQLRLI